MTLLERFIFIRTIFKTILALTDKADDLLLQPQNNFMEINISHYNTLLNIVIHPIMSAFSIIFRQLKLL